MASKHVGLLRSLGGQISLHSMHGRFLLRAAILDIPHQFVNGLPSRLSAAGGEISLHSRYGRYLRQVAQLQTDTGAFRSVEGEVSVRARTDLQPF